MSHHRQHNMMAATLAIAALGVTAGPVAEPVNPFHELDYLRERRTGYSRAPVVRPTGKAGKPSNKKAKRKAAAKSRAKNRKR